MLEEMLKNRAVIPLLKMSDGSDVSTATWRRRREEMLEILQEQAYGYTPPPVSVDGKILEENDIAFAGKVLEQTVRITFDTPGGPYSFPVQLFIPCEPSRPPVFLHLAFRPFPDKYLPIEEVCDNGFAVAIAVYSDITPDTHFGDFSSGLAARYIKGSRSPGEWGKIGMWAYAASRVMDYLAGRSDIDSSSVAVMGHSRLGKTALWCGAQDERFYCVCSNDSGYGGAAIARSGTGEVVKDFLKAGSWDWYCERFKDDVDRDNDKQYDGHMLLSLIAPRLLCVGSAQIDPGADPQSEFLSCVAASDAYRLLGCDGLITPDRMPMAGTTLHSGKIGYHMRPGRHFLSRYDWLHYIAFIKKHSASVKPS